MTFHHFRRLGGAAAALLGAVITIVMANQLADAVAYHDLVHVLRHFAWQPALEAAVATAVSFMALIGREAVAVRVAGGDANPRRSAVALAGACGTALSNTVGFIGLSSAAVRYRIYGSVGLASQAVTRLLALIAIGFTGGLACLVAVLALSQAPVLATLSGWSTTDLRFGAGAVLLGLAGLLHLWRTRAFRVRGVVVPAPTPALALMLALSTALDLLAAAAALWVLLPPVDLPFPAFAAVFAVALAIGGISHVPGGLGIFEAVFVFVLQDRVPTDRLLAGLVIFRIIYFILPLILSTALLASFELRRPAARGAADLGGSAARLTPTFLAALTFIGGAILVVSGATPTFPRRLATLGTHVPLWLIETAQFFASLAGLLLMFAARGLYRRLDAAWWLATPIALLAGFLSLFYGLAYAQAALLAMLFIMLLVAREQFARPASAIRHPFTVGWWLAVTAVLGASIWIFLFAFQNADLAQGAWWEVALYAQAPRALRATLGVCIAAAILGLSLLLRAAKSRPRLPDASDLERALTIIGREDRSDALLALMGDKSLMFSASGRSFLMYAMRGRSWIALYDPVGPRGEWGELITRFVDLAAGQGGRAAFYSVRPDSLPLYIDAGLQAVKLGEEARVDLLAFDLRGSHRSHLRYALKRGARDGLDFQLVPPWDIVDIMPVLKSISSAWLKRRRAREKSFSVAAFDRDYLSSQCIALVRQNGEPVAFASVMVSPGGSDATIGLMRHNMDVSPYTMEFLFVSLILALQQDGRATLSLGTAPLAGLSPSRLGSRWSRLAQLVWRHGGMLYNFQGLRTFKSKFDPTWEPRYLAASGSLGPFMALADAAVLANGASLRKPVS